MCNQIYNLLRITMELFKSFFSTSQKSKKNMYMLNATPTHAKKKKDYVCKSNKSDQIGMTCSLTARTALYRRVTGLFNLFNASKHPQQLKKYTTTQVQSQTFRL